MIFPKPKEEAYFEGSYKLKEKITDFDVFSLYEKYKDGSADVTAKKDASIAGDGYRLSADSGGIKISAGSDVGVFYAVASLKELLFASGGESVPHCEISDSPDFERRSYMLDISRCRMPKLKILKRYADILSALKYNEFLMYMENTDCMKYPAFPELNRDIDCLTPDDIEELDRYCAERFIDLVPKINCFGHMKAWLALPEYRHLEVGYPKAHTATINILEEESLELLDRIFSSVIPCFSSEYVDIGMDEAFGLGKYQLEQICREKGKDRVFVDYLEKICDYVRKKFGKTVIFDSMSVQDSPHTYDDLPENIVALNWSYDLIGNSRAERRCIELKKRGIPICMSCGTANWLSFTGRFDVMSFNLRTFGELGRRYGARTYNLTDWGCGEGHMHHPVWSMVPAALGAQYAWNVGEEQFGEGESFKQDYIYAAQAYADKYIFGAQISKYLYKLQQYYLLEPERIHSSTMCCLMFRKKLTETEYPGFFDLKKCGEDFYFDNVISYVKKVLKDFENVPCGEFLKREVINNADMVILAEELMKIRLHQSVSAEKAAYLTALIDKIADEYKLLWQRLNFDKGMEDFLSQLDNKKKELAKMLLRGDNND